MKVGFRLAIVAVGMAAGNAEHTLADRVRFRRFSLRGLARARGEWDLVCLALNVKRLHVLQAA